MKRIRNNLRKAKILINPLFNNGNIFQKMPYLSVTSRIIVSLDQRFVYIRIPKAANSTVTTLLWSCINNEKLESTKNTQKYKKSFLNAKQLPLKQASMAKKNFFFFVVVRNPYDRILSAYLNKFSTRKYIDRYGEKISKTGDGRLNFTSFCKYLYKEGLYENPHWMPQSEYVWPSYDRLDYIGKVESIQKDLERIFTRIFDDCQADFTNIYGPTRTHAQAKRDNYYNTETKKIINNLYADDFHRFNYEFE